MVGVQEGRWAEWLRPRGGEEPTPVGQERFVESKLSVDAAEPAMYSFLRLSPALLLLSDRVPKPVSSHSRNHIQRGENQKNSNRYQGYSP